MVHGFFVLETVSTFAVCSVRVATLIEYTVTDGELRLSHHVFGP